MSPNNLFFPKFCANVVFHTLFCLSLECSLQTYHHMYNFLHPFSRENYVLSILFMQCLFLLREIIFWFILKILEEDLMIKVKPRSTFQCLFFHAEWNFFFFPEIFLYFLVLFFLQIIYLFQVFMSKGERNNSSEK